MSPGTGRLRRSTREPDAGKRRDRLERVRDPRPDATPTGRVVYACVPRWPSHRGRHFASDRPATRTSSDRTILPRSSAAARKANAIRVLPAACASLPGCGPGGKLNNTRAQPRDRSYPAGHSSDAAADRHPGADSLLWNGTPCIVGAVGQEALQQRPQPPPAARQPAVWRRFERWMTPAKPTARRPQ